MRVLIALPILLLAAAAPADDAAFVAGLGATSFQLDPGGEADGQEHPALRTVEHRAAREDAEQAFRDLVRAAAAGPLYAVGPIWYDNGPGQFNPAVLLTDGTTDNRAIPTVPVLRQMGERAFEDLRPRDDAVAFLAGPGESNGTASWIYGRRGARFYVDEVARRIFAGRPTGTRVLVVRVYPADEDGAPSTLYLADPETTDRLRTWCAAAEERRLAHLEVPPPGRLFPGLSRSLSRAASTRLARVREPLQAASVNDEGLVVIDFKDAADPREQRVEVPVELTEETLFETNRVRRPGPLFTIVEEEIIKAVGTTTSIDATALEGDLAAHRLHPSSARGIADQVRRGAGRSFTSTNLVGGTDYVVAFNRDQRMVAVVYSD